MLKKSIIFSTILFAANLSQGLNSGIGVVSDDVAKAIMCEENTSISDHMRRMGFLIRELTGSVQSAFDGESKNVNKQTVIENTQMLRVHLSTVFTLTPPKILAIDAKKPQTAKLIFQGYILRLMELTLQLETELLKEPIGEKEVKMQQIHVEDHITEIYETVEKAHKLFRD